MRTTQDDTAVDTATVTAPITKQLLEARNDLPHVANGHTPAPSNPRAAYLRKEITRGRCDPIGTLYTVGECDLVDGVPLFAVTAPLYALIAALETAAVAEQARRARPIPTLVRSQTKLQYLENQAEHDVLEHPESPIALDKLRRTTAQEIEMLTTIEGACERELAVIRCTPPAHAFGARRGSLQSVR